MANGRCMMHGGKSLVGIASPTFVTGRYSKHIPTRLAAKYHESQSDPDLLNLRSEIALLDSRMADVLEAVSNGEAGELWKRLKEALAEYDKCRGKNAEAERHDAFNQIRWLVNEGYQEYMSWMEIRTIAEDRRRLVDSERSRLKDMQQMITSERAALLIGALTASIRKHVTDRDALAAIAADLRALVPA